MQNKIVDEDRNIVEHYFTYHGPNDDQQVRLKEIRMTAKEMAYCIIRNCPPSPDRSAAIRRLREAIMIANAAVVLEDK